MRSSTSIDSQIRSRTESFAAELGLLVRQSALEAVQGVLGAAAVVRRVPRRARRSARALASRPAVRKAVRRAKRTSEEVLELAARVRAHVRTNAGQSVGQIGKAMRIPTKVLQLPIAKLLQAKKLRTEGRLRGTRYFAGGRTEAARRPRRARARKARAPIRRKRSAKASKPVATLKPAPRWKARGTTAADPVTAPAAAVPDVAAAET